MQTGETGKNGFSILEILVVVGIMAALVGLAIPSYQDYVETTRQAVMETNFRAVRKAVMEFHSDLASYPTEFNIKNMLVPRYLMDFPTDPAFPAPATWGYKYLPGPPETIIWDTKYQYLIQ